MGSPSKEEFRFERSEQREVIILDILVCFEEKQDNLPTLEIKV